MEIKNATNKSYAYVVVSAKEYAKIKAKALKGLTLAIQNTKHKIIHGDKTTTIR